MEQLPLNFEHRPALDREDFLVTSGNVEAVKMLDSYPSWPSHAIIIYGANGCGKTHLAHVFVKKTGGKTPLISATDLTAEQVPGLLTKSGNLVVEDIETLKDEEALLHLYNYAKEIGAHLLMTSETAPADLAIKLPDLSSRLLAISAIRIGNPDDAFIKALLVKLFADRQLLIGEEAIDYAIKNMERSFKGAGDLVAAADKLSLAKHKAITIPLLREILKNDSLT